MSRPLTYEQSRLFEAESLLATFSPLYEQRLSVLEACASLIGGFDIVEYWTAFGTEAIDEDTIIDVAEQLLSVLINTNLPTALALSSLAREPITISKKKQNGVFYTDFRLAQFIAKDCAPFLQKESKIADIAAGSGILLASVAELYYSRYPENYNQWITENVYAFDLSEYALRGARIAMATHSSEVDAIKSMCKHWFVCDSLLSPHFPEDKFDIVVGNPPWGKIKLSRHSFVNKSADRYYIYGSQYGTLNQELFLSEKQNALDYSKALKSQYSLLRDAEPDMYIAFLQRAINTVRPGGHLSYIVPAGLIRSLGTEPLRRFLINHSDTLKYYLLDNKAHFFEIDTRFKFVVVSQSKSIPNNTGCTEFMFEICEGNAIGVNGTEKIRFNVKELEKIRPDLTVPECRNTAEKDLFIKICSRGSSWRKKWKIDIAREVDMTNDRSIFSEKASDGLLPVIEGRMVQQFRFGAKAYVSGSGRSAKWIPSADSVQPQFFIEQEKLDPQLLNRVFKQRVGYCDIAGQTNERAMMTAVVPPGVVCGNKVPTIVFTGENGDEYLHFFIGITNSFVFDWILRRVLSTTVNYFLLFSLPMPDIDLSSELAQRIISMSKELSLMGAEFYTDAAMGKMRAELDVAVAEAFGLAFEDLVLIMKDFPLLDRHQPPLDGEKRSTYTRDLFLSVAEERFQQSNRYYTQRALDGDKISAKAYVPTEMVNLCFGGAE